MKLERHVFVFFFFFLEKIKTVVSSVFLWVVFTFLFLYCLVVVSLIVKKVTNLKKLIALNLVPGCKCFLLFAVQLQKDSPSQ